MNTSLQWKVAMMNVVWFLNRSEFRREIIQDGSGKRVLPGERVFTIIRRLREGPDSFMHYLTQVNGLHIVQVIVLILLKYRAQLRLGFQINWMSRGGWRVEDETHHFTFTPFQFCQCRGIKCNDGEEEAQGENRKKDLIYINIQAQAPDSIFGIFRNFLNVRKQQG